MSSGAVQEDFLLDAFQVELLGCLAGLQVVVKLGITHITLEVDGTLVKEAIETKAYRLAFVGVITEIKQIISANLSSCIVSICKHDSNRVTHALAAFGCNPASYCLIVWSPTAHYYIENSLNFV